MIITTNTIWENVSYHIKKTLTVMIHFNIINIQYKVINYQYMQNLKKLNIAALTHHVIREMILEADEMHSLENARPLAE